MYEEEDFLQLSGIQHFAFCKRQWAFSMKFYYWKSEKCKMDIRAGYPGLSYAVRCTEVKSKIDFFEKQFAKNSIL